MFANNGSESMIHWLSSLEERLLCFLLRNKKRLIVLLQSESLFDKVLTRKHLQRCFARSTIKGSLDSAMRIFFGVEMQ